MGAALKAEMHSSLTFDTEAAKNRPVSKVITLLKDMLKQLEKEAEEDGEIYDKMACWCETNDKEKTKSIADAEARISDLTTKIEELTASSARLNTEIRNLEKEVAENQAALDKATAIRQKQLAEFNEEETKPDLKKNALMPIQLNGFDSLATGERSTLSAAKNPEMRNIRAPHRVHMPNEVPQI